MYNFLLKPRSLATLSIFTSIITALFCYFLLYSINYSFNGYINDVTPDVAQHLSGWYAFVHEPWHFPLLKIYLLNYPIGTTISLTDSLPLFALFFKLIRSILPVDFNYFGIVIIFNYFFQAFAALTLAIALNRKNYLTTLGLVLFAISAPPLSIFVGYEESLTFQGLIILAISGYYFVFNKKFSIRGCHWFFGSLIALSLLIHPYLTAMIYPFYLLCLWQIKHCDNSSFKQFIIPIINMHLAILLEFYIFGLGSGANASGDFGVQALNLIQPFSGGLITFNPAAKDLYPDISENVGYLGLGLMLSIFIAVLLQGKQLKKAFNQHKALIAVGVLLVIFSIYGDMWFGSHHLITLSAPKFFLTNAFRTNERFIWPVWYLLMTFAVISLSKNSQQKAVVFFIPIFLMIQLMDVSNYFRGIRQNLKHDFAHRVYATPYYAMLNSLFNSSKPTPDYANVKNLIAQSKIIIFYPAPLNLSNLATLAPSSKVSFYILAELQLMSAMAGIPINNAYIAHYTKTESRDEANLYNNLNPKLLISPANLASPTIKSLLKNHPSDCHLWNNIYYCRYVHK